MSTRSPNRFLLLFFLLSPFLAGAPRAVAQPGSQASHPSRRERRKGANPNDLKRELQVDGTTRSYLHVATQVGLPVVYEGEKLELGYRIDVLVETWWWLRSSA
jgi:hypothetical protein